jgi:hypothetical protein
MALHQPVMPAQHAPHLMRWAEIVVATILAIAVGVAVWQVATRITPVSNSPAQTIDQPWIIKGTNGGGLVYTGIQYPVERPAYMIEGTNGGGLIYTGIQYPAPRPAWIVEGTNGGGIIYTGIQFPATPG